MSEQPKAQVKPGGSSRVADPEMRAASLITRLLSELDEAARQRIVGYLASRFLPATKNPMTADRLGA